MRNKLIWFQFGKKRSISKYDFIRILNIYSVYILYLHDDVYGIVYMVEIRDWCFQQHSNYNERSIRLWIRDVCKIYSYSIHISTHNFDDSIFLWLFSFPYFTAYKCQYPNSNALKIIVNILNHPNRDYTYYTWHIIAWICIPNYSNWLSVLYI